MNKLIIKSCDIFGFFGRKNKTVRISKGIRHFVVIRNIPAVNKTVTSTRNNAGNLTGFSVSESASINYHCVLYSAMSGASVESDINTVTLRFLDKTWMIFGFSSDATCRLDEGRVSLSVYDDNRNELYRKNNYAKLIDTIL